MKIKFTTESGVTKYLKLGISSVLGLQDILDTKSDTDHIHSEYALTTHNHDTVYSKLTHNHDSSYADISHNHDTVYSGIGHNHLMSEVTGLQAALDNKAASNHNHDTVYAEIDHNHDTVYADIEHTHVGSQIYVKSEELGTTLNDWTTSIENELSDLAGINHNHDTTYEPIISTKGTAFNKDFGTTAGTIAEGNHVHSGDYHLKQPLGVPRVNYGDPLITEMALFDNEYTNRTEFFPIDRLKIEKNITGYSWTDITTTFNETRRKQLVGGDVYYGISFKDECDTTKVRIYFDAAVDYNPLNTLGDLYMGLDAGYHQFTAKIIKKKNASSNWEYHTNSEIQLATNGDIAHLYLPFSSLLWQNNYNNYRYIGVELKIFWDHNYGSWSRFYIYNLQFWGVGGGEGRKRTIYTTDENKNVRFPGDIYSANEVYAKSIGDSGKEIPLLEGLHQATNIMMKIVTGGASQTGYDLTITTKKERIYWAGGSYTDYYDNFYYRVNGNSTYTAITYPVTNQVIPNVIMVSFYYDLAEPGYEGGYHTITGNYTTIGDYYWLDGPISITFQSSYPCFVKGTKITLADMTYKNVEDITYDDELLVWDFDKGKFTSAKPIWILKPQKAPAYNKLVFSDGSELRTVNQHRIFNAEEGKFTYPMTEDTPIGTITFNDKGELIALVSKEVVEEEVEYYNIITDYHINLFASSILTSCRLSNLYPIKDMKYIKDDRELHSPEIFNEVSPKWVRGLRLLEQPLEVNRENAVKFDNSLVDYVKRLESTKL